MRNVIDSLYTIKIALQELKHYICTYTLKMIYQEKRITGIMASNTNIAALPEGRVSVIIFDQPIDVLLISF